MYSLTLQNAPIGLRPGILTEYCSEEFNDPDQDAKFNDIMVNAEKQIQSISQHLAEKKKVKENIEEYKHSLQKIQTDVDFFLDKDQEMFKLLDKMIDNEPK